MNFKSESGDSYSISQDGNGYGILTIIPSGGAPLQFKFAQNEMNKWIRFLSAFSQVLAAIT